MNEPKIKLNPDLKYKRKCKNWITSFAQWSLPRSEAPESFHLWAAIYTLSSVLRRHVCIPKRLLGGWEIYPHMYIIFVAPPGKARKTTTANYSEELLVEIKGVLRAPTAVTIEDMLRMMTEDSPDNSITVFSGEFASFVSKSEGKMYDVLTDLFDGKRSYSVGTISRGYQFTEKPCINLLAATTPDWIAGNMPESAIGGGFASRVIFVFEERVRRRQLYYEELDYSYLDSIRDDLIADLYHILSIEGEFAIDSEAKSFMEQWYRALDKQISESYNTRMSGFYERKPAHVHKLAMIFHLAEYDDLVLTKEDFTRAIQVIEKLEIKMPKTFQHIGKNIYVNDMSALGDFVEQRGKVTAEELYNKFVHVGTSDMIDKLLKAMAMLGKIHKVDDGISTWWIWRDKKEG